MSSIDTNPNAANIENIAVAVAEDDVLPANQSHKRWIRWSEFGHAPNSRSPIKVMMDIFSVSSV
jgi:hypothetical protein